ncbi:MAG: DHH family phosphoesterase [Candidatus Binatia bacterium]
MADRSAEPVAEPRLRPVRKGDVAPSDSSDAPWPSKWAELAAALERHRGERLLILLSGYPDPDSIASGLALQHLARAHDIESRLLSFHEVSHQENQALVTKLELDLWLYDGHCDLEPYTLYAMVDTQRIDTPVQALLRDKTFLAFVDHHKRAGEIAAEFVDVREEAGSTAGIFAEYLRQAHPDGLSDTDPEHVKLATALMHGIRSDTRLMLEATAADFLGAAFLLPAVDQTLLRSISAQSLSPAVMDMIQAALERRRIYDTFLFSDVGFVRKEHRDGIPQAADFLLTRAGIDTVLVFGIVDGKVIEGSLRTRSDTVNPDLFLKKAFGLDDARGGHYGGGNVRNKGGFQIPLGFLAQHKDRDQLYRLACEIVHERFLEAIGRHESSV